MRILTAILVATLLLCPALQLHAHDACTDDIGCHVDPKTGRYHCPSGPLKGRSFQSESAARAIMPTEGLRVEPEAETVETEETKLIFYMPHHFGATATRTIFLREDNSPSQYSYNKIARMRTGRFISLRVKAGTYFIKSRNRKGIPTRVELEAGAVIYLQHIWSPGGWLPDGRYEPVDEASFIEHSSRLKPLAQKYIFDSRVKGSSGRCGEATESRVLKFDEAR